MTQFKVGDLVRITAPSTGINSHISMVGLEGYIEEIVEDCAQFMELRPNGDYCGCGGVPLECLTLVNDNQKLQQWMRENIERKERNYQEAMVRTERYNNLRNKYFDEIIVEHHSSLDREELDAIFKKYEEFEKEWDRTYGW